MNNRETRRYDVFVRVQTFGTDNAADFAPASTAATNFATVTTVINGLNTAKAGQKPGRDTSKEVLLDAIRLAFRTSPAPPPRLTRPRPALPTASARPHNSIPAPC